MLRWTKQKGFTIVELLIVIVVIGILAAITIVAFNGISTRAENTKTVTGVGSYYKAIQAYGINTGAYPVAGYPCLGPLGTTCANTTDSSSACFGAGAAGANSAFDTAIKTVLSTAPSLSSQTMECNGKQYGGAYYSSNAQGTTATITYFLKGNQPCVKIAGASLSGPNVDGGATQCTVALPGI